MKINKQQGLEIKCIQEQKFLEHFSLLKMLNPLFTENNLWS